MKIITSSIAIAAFSASVLSFAQGTSEATSTTPAAAAATTAPASAAAAPAPETPQATPTAVPAPEATPTQQATPTPQATPTAAPVVPEATPTATPTAAPTPTTETGKPSETQKPETDLEKMKAGGTKKDSRDYHLETPDVLDDLLAIRLGFGLGTGTKEFSPDHMGFSLEANYTVHNNVFAALRYTSISGVKSIDDQSYVAQTYLIGGGVEQKFKEKMRFRESGYIGISHLHAWDLVFFGTTKSTYGFTPAANFSFDYQVWEKSFVTTGLGMQLGKAAWYDIQFGVAAYF